MPTLNKITPETAPVGARMLLKDQDSRFYHPYEVVIIEWSPAGKAVKVMLRNGIVYWSEMLVREGVVFEPLPIFQPTKQAVADAVALSQREVAS